MTQDVRAHFRSLPPRYALAVDPEDVLTHMELLAEAAEPLSRPRVLASVPSSVQPERIPSSGDSAERGRDDGGGQGARRKIDSGFVVLAVICRYSPCLLEVILASICAAGGEDRLHVRLCFQVESPSFLTQLLLILLTMELSADRCKDALSHVSISYVSDTSSGRTSSASYAHVQSCAARLESARSLNRNISRQCLTRRTFTFEMIRYMSRRRSSNDIGRYVDHASGGGSRLAGRRLQSRPCLVIARRSIHFSSAAHPQWTRYTSDGNVSDLLASSTPWYVVVGNCSCFGTRGIASEAWKFTAQGYGGFTAG